MTGSVGGKGSSKSFSTHFTEGWLARDDGGGEVVGMDVLVVLTSISQGGGWLPLY